MEKEAFSTALFSLFDRQRFEGNDHLAALIRETESRYDDRALTDDALLFVSAAGETAPRRKSAQSEDDGL